MQQLKSGSLLQGGKYRIEKVLGQGGFGITYLATQELLDRKVCIKEFFFKEYCERDETTSHVTLGTQTNRELVERFMEKFIKEARTISTLNHPHIIRIYDIFKENNTAYYVMEYIEGESLNDKVNQSGALPESEAIDYTKQVASALEYIHQRSINHLDVKPANIMVRKSDNKAILIDFGVSKQYDKQGGQTSTTPVGISHGYSPLEQYKSNGVQKFSPQSDVYSLAATLYKLLTGITPNEAIEIQEDGVEVKYLKERNVSQGVIDTIVTAMKSRKKRIQSVDEFIKTLESFQDEKSMPITKKQPSTDIGIRKEHNPKNNPEINCNNYEDDERTVLFTTDLKDRTNNTKPGELQEFSKTEIVQAHWISYFKKRDPLVNVVMVTLALASLIGGIVYSALLLLHIDSLLSILYIYWNMCFLAPLCVLSFIALLLLFRHKQSGFWFITMCTPIVNSFLPISVIITYSDYYDRFLSNFYYYLLIWAILPIFSLLVLYGILNIKYKGQKAWSLMATSPTWMKTCTWIGWLVFSLLIFSIFP